MLLWLSTDQARRHRRHRARATAIAAHDQLIYEICHSSPVAVPALVTPARYPGRVLTRFAGPDEATAKAWCEAQPLQQQRLRREAHR